MGEVKRARLEAELVQHYALGRGTPDPKALDKLVPAMVAEDAWLRHTQSRRMGAVEFIAAQVRYIPAWTWAVQITFVALMWATAYAAGSVNSTKTAIGILSALSVLVGVPTMQASRLHGVTELEYACPYNAAGVMVARLIVLGCSSALVVALMVGATASVVDASAFDVALWACLPFFLSCAGSLAALRRARPAVAPLLSVAWSVSCSLALLMLASVLPGLYAGTSLAAWALAATAALAWLVREVTLTLRAVSAGLDVFSPQLARTYH